MGKPRRMHRLRLIAAAIGRNEEALQEERRALYAAAARVARRKSHLQRLTRLRDRLLCVDDVAPELDSVEE